MITLQLGTLKLRISVLFCGLLAFLAYADQTGLVPTALPAILMHECGHLAVLCYFHEAPQELEINLGSIALKGCFTLQKRALITMYLCGPACNFAGAGLLFCLQKLLPGLALTKPFFIWAALGVLNLLPLQGLDGGSVLRCIFSNRTNAQKICRFISFLTCLFVAAAALVSALLFSAPQFALPAIYLFLLFLLKKY